MVMEILLLLFNKSSRWKFKILAFQFQPILMMQVFAQILQQQSMVVYSKLILTSINGQIVSVEIMEISRMVILCVEKDRSLWFPQQQHLMLLNHIHSQAMI